VRLNDQIASTIQVLADLLVACPDDDPKKTAETFEHAAKVLGGTAAWLSGQAVLLRGQPCEVCAGQGHQNGERCEGCGGSGKVPERADPEGQGRR